MEIVFFPFLTHTEPDECEDGYFGKICELQCHCRNNNRCKRQTGVCTDNQCAHGWGGYDCQQGECKNINDYFTQFEKNNAHYKRNIPLVKIKADKSRFSYLK